MRKAIRLTLVLCIIILLSSINITESRNNALVNTEAKIASLRNQFAADDQEQQKYYNLFVSMLYPYVKAAINDYYDEYMTYLPGEDPHFYDFIKIEGTPGEAYSYTVVLEVSPYVGPHNTVGRDRITFKIDLGNVKVEKFEHLESHKIPPNYQNIIKKPLPNTQ